MEERYNNKKGKILSILTSLAMMLSLAMPVNAEEGIMPTVSISDSGILDEMINTNSNIKLERNYQFEDVLLINKNVT